MSRDPVDQVQRHDAAGASTTRPLPRAPTCLLRFACGAGAAALAAIAAYRQCWISDDAYLTLRTTEGLLTSPWVAEGRIKRALRDPLDGVTRIGLEEVSHRKGHGYLTVVIDHDTGKLIWAAPRRSARSDARPASG